MKLTDCIAKYLKDELHVDTVFGVTGGFITHLFDSLDKAGIRYICCNHEQACAMAADCYTRVSGKIGIVLTTSGPGAANAINGVMCAHYDSIPMIVITGQCPQSSIDKNKECRQRGFQEVNVKDIYKPFTKYSTIIDEPNDVLKKLDEAYYHATTGRKGAVVVDLPDDIQRASVSYNYISRFQNNKSIEYPSVDEYSLENNIKYCKKPLVVVGRGCKLDNCEQLVIELINKKQIPFVTTWGATDILEFDHPLNIGNFGTIGTIYGNKAVQEADLLIVLGSRLDSHLTTSEAKTFAPRAKKIIVDIEQSEIDQMKRRGIDSFYIRNRVRDVCKVLMRHEFNKDIRWIKYLQSLKVKYPVYKKDTNYPFGTVNPYVFLDELHKISNEGDIIVTDAGANLSYTMQGYKVKKNQHLISDFNHSTMGYSLPASIGASLAGENVICIIGDGAFQMNVQELATIRKLKLPIKIFIFDNKGYGMIMQTQDDWLESRYVASRNEDGLCLPDNIQNIVKAYGLDVYTINNHNELKKLKGILSSNKPSVTIVNMSQEQRIPLKLKVGQRLEDMNYG